MVLMVVPLLYLLLFDYIVTMNKIDAFDQWCLQKLLGIRWYHHVWNSLKNYPEITPFGYCRSTMFLLLRPNCTNARCLEDLNSFPF